MTTSETIAFIKLVGEMRESQKKFFKSKMSYDLQKAKDLERQVDAMLKNETSDSVQKSLF